MIVALLLAAADPCAPPPPAAAPDEAAARAYVEVGESEQAAGADPSARVAFLEALRLDPSSAAARRGLDAVCADARFEEGRKRLDAGDPRGAAELLHSVPGSRPAALLEGIARYQLGDDAGARPLLEEAGQDPDLSSAARFYRGLVALREDEARAAEAQLDQVPPDAPFGPAAAEMARIARRSGRLVLSALAESGYDSNVTLLPSGVPGGQDGMGSLALAAVARPMGESGPWVRASGLYRRQLSLHDYDLGAVGGAAGWQLGRAANHAGVEYDYDYLALGAAPFLSAHRLAATAAGSVGQWLATAEYSVRFESYRTFVTSSFSGTLHSGELMLGARLGGGSIRAGYRVGRDFAQYPETSFFGHGPRALLELPLGSRARIAADASAAWLTYDAVDPALLVQRADTLLDGSLTGELDLADRLTLRLAASGRHAVSNAPELSYDRFAITLGLLVSAGFF